MTLAAYFKAKLSPESNEYMVRASLSLEVHSRCRLMSMIELLLAGMEALKVTTLARSRPLPVRNAALSGLGICKLRLPNVQYWIVLSG